MKRYAIGIDLGGTSVKYALIDNEGVFHFQGRIPSKADVSADAVVGQILYAINEVKAYAASEGFVIDGIGIGTPGIVDSTSRIVMGGAENIKGWENVHLADIIEKETGLSVLVGNDANMMGLGETRFGAGKGMTDVVFITVGTGIGGAVVIGGKLFGGYANRGTELGHVPLIANGEKCACGATGCLEHYASASALVRMFVSEAPAYGYTIPDGGARRSPVGCGLFAQTLPISGTGNSRFYKYLQPTIGGDRWRYFRCRTVLYRYGEGRSIQECNG